MGRKGTTKHLITVSQGTQFTSKSVLKIPGAHHALSHLSHIMPYLRGRKLHTQSQYTAMVAFSHGAADYPNKFSASLLNCLDFKHIITNENQCTVAIFTYIFC